MNGLKIIVFIILFILPPFGSAESADDFSRSVLSIETQSGTHKFSVELALTSAQRAQGLQGRKEMAPNAGMLFDFHTEQQVTMWMKNTNMSLDMIFIAADGTILTIAKRTTPHSLKYITSGKPVKGVLELNAGTTTVLGIRNGDRVLHEIFAGN